VTLDMVPVNRVKGKGKRKSVPVIKTPLPRIRSLVSRKGVNEPEAKIVIRNPERLKIDKNGNPKKEVSN